MRAMSIASLLGLLVLATSALSETSPPPATTATQDSQPALTRQERVFGLATFHAAAKQHFAWFEKASDLDWDKAFMDFLPLVEEEQTTLEYYRTLQRFAALLRDGHTEVHLPQDIQKQQDRLPLTLGFIEGQWVVLERHPTEEILAEDIPPGTILLAVDGAEPTRYFEANVFPYIAAGSDQAKRTRLNWMWTMSKGEQVPLTLRYPDGKQTTRTLRASRRSVKWTDALREKYLLAWHRDPQFGSSFVAEGILHVRYGTCDQKCLEAFGDLLASLSSEQLRGMILDLRGNPGGSTPVKAAGRLISKPIPWYACRSRWSASYYQAQTQALSQADKAAYLKWHGLPATFGPDWLDVTPQGPIQPEANHYDGPLVILIDAETGSAAEDLVVLLHGCGRATVIGERSAGSTGQPMLMDLPGGGGARICTIQVRYPDGREFIGPGIRPDVPVTRTLKAIAEGRDEVLQAAIQFLQSAPSAAPASAPAHN